MFPENVNNNFGTSHVGSTAEGHCLYLGNPESHSGLAIGSTHCTRHMLSNLLYLKLRALCELIIMQSCLSANACILMVIDSVHYDSRKVTTS